MNNLGSVMGTTWPTYPGCSVVSHLLEPMVNELKVNVKGQYWLDLNNAMMTVVLFFFSLACLLVKTSCFFVTL